MADGFSLAGELGISLNQASVRAALKNVETQFRNVNATINVNIDKRAIAGIESVQKAAAGLTRDLNQSAAAAKSLSQNLNLRNISGEFQKASAGAKSFAAAVKASGTDINGLKDKVGSLARGLSSLGDVNLSKKFSGIDTAKASVDKLTQSLSRASTAARTLKQDLAGISLGSIGGIKENVASIERLGTAAKQVENSLRGAAEASKKAGKESVGASAGIGELRSTFEELGRDAGFAARRLGAFTVAASGIYGFIAAVTGGIREAIAFEKQVVKIAQVNEQSVRSLRSLTDEVGRLASDLGVGRAALLDVAETLSQAGLSAKDTEIALGALAKTDLAPTFRNLTETTEGSISILNSFGNRLDGTGVQVRDLEGALGSINRVSAKFAVESQDIIKAVRTAGAVFAASSKQTGDALLPLQEFIAVFTSVRDTTRESADSIATGLRTIFTRIQRPQTIEFLKQFNIQLTELDGGSEKFVGSFEAVKRIAEGLQNLDTRNIQFFRIAEELGGYRQISKVIPLVQQLAKAQNALNVAQGGTGSLEKDAIKAQESLANRFEKTRQTFLKLIYDLTQTNSFQSLAKGILGVTDSLVGLASGFKELVPYLIVFGAIKTAAAGIQYGKGFISGIRKGSTSDSTSPVPGLPFAGGRPDKDIASSSTANNSLVSATTANTVALNKLTMALGRVSIGNLASPKRFAAGGIVGGSGRTDSVSALLSPGEVVLDRDTVQKAGGFRAAKKKYAQAGAVTRPSRKGISAYLKKIIGVDVDLDRLLPEFRTADSLKPIFGVDAQGSANSGTGVVTQKRRSSPTTTFHEIVHNADRLIFENLASQDPEYGSRPIDQRYSSLIEGSPTNKIAKKSIEYLAPIKYGSRENVNQLYGNSLSVGKEGLAIAGEFYSDYKNRQAGIKTPGTRKSRFKDSDFTSPEGTAILADIEKTLLPLISRTSKQGRYGFKDLVFGKAPKRAESGLGLAQGGSVSFGRGPSLARVNYNPDDAKNQKKMLKMMFPGKSLKEAEGILASIVGAPDDAVVSMGAEYFGSQDVSIGHPHIVAAHRKVNVARKSIDNEFLKVSDSAPEGFATQLLAKQVENASAQGFKSLSTLAAGAKNQDRNGYYTWARLGFDGQIPPLFNNVQDSFPGVTTIQELFARKGGKEWWKENGRDFDGFFDLAPDSKNTELLGKYIKEREGQGRGIPRFAEGGLVPGYGNTDSVPMELPIGSFVLRKKAVAALRKQGRFASGGSVPALVMPGEYIYGPKEASRIGLPKLTAMNRADTSQTKFAQGGSVGSFADGGRASAIAQANNPGLNIGLVTGNLAKAIKELGLNQVQLGRVTGKFTKELARGVQVQDAFGDAIDFAYRQQNQINESQRKARAGQEVAAKQSVAERRQAVQDQKAARLANPSSGTKFGPQTARIYGGRNFIPGTQTVVGQNQYEGRNVGPLRQVAAPRPPMPRVIPTVRPPIRDANLPLIEDLELDQYSRPIGPAVDTSRKGLKRERDRKRAIERAEGNRVGFLDSQLFDGFRDPNQDAAFQRRDAEKEAERKEARKGSFLGRARNGYEGFSEKFNANSFNVSAGAFTVSAFAPSVLGDTPTGRGVSSLAAGVGAGAQFGPIGAAVGGVIGGLQGLASYLNDTEIEKGAKLLSQSVIMMDKAFTAFNQDENFEKFGEAFAAANKLSEGAKNENAVANEIGSARGFGSFGTAVSYGLGNIGNSTLDGLSYGANLLSGNAENGGGFDSSRTNRSVEESFKRAALALQESRKPEAEVASNTLNRQLDKGKLKIQDFDKLYKSDEGFKAQLRTIFLASDQGLNANKKIVEAQKNFAGPEVFDEINKSIDKAILGQIDLEQRGGSRGDSFLRPQGAVADLKATRDYLLELEQNASAVFDQLGRRVELVANAVSALNDKLGEFGQQANYIASSVGGGGVRSFTASRVNSNSQSQLDILAGGVATDSSPLAADFQNAVTSRKFIENQLPDILKKSFLEGGRNPTDEDPFSGIEAEITSGLGRDNPLLGILKKQIQERFFTVEGSSVKRRADIGQDEFINSTQSITGELVPITEKVIENFLAVRDLTAKFANEYGNALNQSQQLLLSAEQKRVEAATFVAEQAVDLKTKQGENVSIADLSAGRSARLAGLGVGGNTAPDDLVARILEQQATRAGVETNQQRRINSGDTRPANVKAIEDNTRLLSSIDTSIQRNTKALDIMATDTSRLAAINQKLGERAARREQFQGTLEGIATAGPEGLAEITKQFRGALAFVEKGQVGRRPEDLASQLAGLRALAPVFQAKNPNFDQKGAELGLVKQYLTQAGLLEGIKQRGGDPEAFTKAFLDRQDASDPNQILLKLREEAIGVISDAQTAQAQILERAAQNTALIAPQIKLGFEQGLAGINESLKGLGSEINRIDVTGNVTVVGNVQPVNGPRGEYQPVTLATGGFIRGPGGPKGDKIPAMLSDKEFVVNAKAAQENSAFLSHINAGGKVARFWRGYDPKYQKGPEINPSRYLVNNAEDAFWGTTRGIIEGGQAVGGALDAPARGAGGALESAFPVFGKVSEYKSNRITAEEEKPNTLSQNIALMNKGRTQKQKDRADKAYDDAVRDADIKNTKDKAFEARAAKYKEPVSDDIYDAYSKNQREIDVSIARRNNKDIFTPEGLLPEKMSVLGDNAYSQKQRESEAGKNSAVQIEAQSKAFEVSQLKAQAEYKYEQMDVKAYKAAKSVTPEQKLASISDTEMQARFAAAQRQQTQKPLTGYQKPKEQKRPVSLDMRGPSYLAQEGQHQGSKKPGRYAPKIGKVDFPEKYIVARQYDNKTDKLLNPEEETQTRFEAAYKANKEAKNQRNIAANPGYKDPSKSRYAPKATERGFFGVAEDALKRRDTAANPITSGFAKREKTAAERLEEAKRDYGRRSIGQNSDGTTNYAPTERQQDIGNLKLQNRAKYGSIGERIKAQEDKRAAFVTGQVTPPPVAPSPQQSTARQTAGPPPNVTRGVTTGANGPSSAPKQGENSIGAADTNLKAFNDSFATSIANLDKVAARLEAVKIMGNIEVKGVHTVNVVHNGADVFKSLDSSIAKMVEDKVGAAFTKLFNTDGTPKNLNT